MRKRFIPVTPGDTPLFDLQSQTEQGAIKKLLRAAAHMPYGTWEEFQKRGYTIAELLPSEDELNP